MVEALDRDNIECICKVLLQSGEISKLDSFIQRFSRDSRTHVLQKSLAYIEYNKGENITKIFDILESWTFPIKYHKSLQDLW